MAENTDYIVNVSRKYGPQSVTCKACMTADTIDTRIILDDETTDDAYAAHTRTIYHQDTITESELRVMDGNR
jgi:hypothetical protein